MSQALPAGVPSTDALLRMEAICDRFEDDAKHGIARQLEFYCTDAPPEIQSQLRAELERLKSALEAGGAAARTYQGDKSVVADAIQTRQDGRRAVGTSATRAGMLLNRRFELVDQVGEGGNGSVWKARDHELQRWVAVKIPHGAAVGDAERFIREARSAAQLQHPNIVRVHEVGRDQEICYLVSELIEGESLAQRLRQGALPRQDAIALLAKVADAIAYAHRSGVVHRDLKPQNILIDGAGQPYVTDFGIAKNANLDDATITLEGQLLGTPAYMAPEQARGASNEADERTDVYSLGVVLFKLLTGDVPFHGSLDSVVYQVIHLEAPTPRRWNQEVPRDLETICLKCLEKSPAKRFASAGELHDELNRFLDGKPILSRPVSLGGQVWRWVLRNPRLATLTTASVVLLVALAVGSTAAAVLLNQARVREAKARADAVAAQLAAETEARVSRESLGFLESTFEISDPVASLFSGNQPPASNPPQVKEMIVNAVARVRGELQSQPLARARLMDTLGNVCRGIGLYPDAESLLAEAADIRADHELSYAPRDLRLARANNLFFRAWLNHDLSKADEAETLYGRCLAELAAGDASNSLLAADVRFHLGRLLLEHQRNAEAEPLFQNAVEIRQQQLPADSRLITAAKLGLQLSRTPVDGLPPMAQVAALLQGEDWGTAIAADFAPIMFQRQLGDYGSATASYRRVLAQLEQHLTDRHPVYILARGDYASLLWEAGNYREAYPIAREVLAAGRTMAPGNRHLRRALRRLAFETLFAGRLEEADGYYRELQRLTDPREFDFEIEHGLLWTSLAAGRIDEAEAHSQAMLDRVDQYAVEQAAWTIFAHARFLDKAGRSNEAQPFDARALAAVKSISRPMMHPIWTERMGLICAHNKEFVQADEFFQRAYQLEVNLRPSGHPRIADRLIPLGRSHLRAGRADQAAELLERAYEIRKRWLPEDDGRIEVTRRELERARQAARPSGSAP